MTRIRGAALVALAAATLACTARGVGSSRLDVRGPAWVVDGFDAGIEIATLGALGERDVTVVVAVGSKVVGRIPVSEARARFTLPAGALAPGTHRVTVKTGSERSELVLRVVPFAYVAAPALLVLTMLAAALVRRRRAAING